MKRHGNLHAKICSIENLRLADKIAQSGKKRQYGVIVHNRQAEANLELLQAQLLSGTFRTSKYVRFTVYEEKEREVFRLPYFPDRIVHHAIMNVLEPVITPMFTADSVGNIKGRGVHSGADALKKVLKDVPGTTYCLKIDIKKFYPSVDHGVMKQIIRRKIKDRELLTLLDEIIDSAPGLPIGNYISQPFSNLYLTGLDHWIKEVKRVKYYLRYVDDMVILAPTKSELHALLADIRQYLTDLHLEIKDNYQVFQVADRGIDVLGYRFYHTHTLMRNRNKKRFARAVARNAGRSVIEAHKGWAKHCNSKHLLKKLGV